MEMYLDEAIRNCLETAAKHENSQEVRDEHIQLAEWLTELKVRRAIQMPPMYSLSPAVGGFPLTQIPPYESISNNPTRS